MKTRILSRSAYGLLPALALLAFTSASAQAEGFTFRDPPQNPCGVEYLITGSGPISSEHQAKLNCLNDFRAEKAKYDREQTAAYEEHKKTLPQGPFVIGPSVSSGPVATTPGTAQPTTPNFVIGPYNPPSQPIKSINPIIEEHPPFVIGPYKPPVEAEDDSRFVIGPYKPPVEDYTRFVIGPYESPDTWSSWDIQEQTSDTDLSQQFVIGPSGDPVYTQPDFVIGPYAPPTATAPVQTADEPRFVIGPYAPPTATAPVQTADEPRFVIGPYAPPTTTAPVQTADEPRFVIGPYAPPTATAPVQTADEPRFVIGPYAPPTTQTQASEGRFVELPSSQAGPAGLYELVGGSSGFYHPKLVKEQPVQAQLFGEDSRFVELPSSQANPAGKYQFMFGPNGTYLELVEQTASANPQFVIGPSAPPSSNQAGAGTNPNFVIGPTDPTKTTCDTSTMTGGATIASGAGGALAGGNAGRTTAGGVILSTASSVAGSGSGRSTASGNIGKSPKIHADETYYENAGSLARKELIAKGAVSKYGAPIYYQQPGQKMPSK